MGNKMEIYKGDHKNFTVTVYDADDATVDITGAEVVFTVRKKFTDDNPVIERKNSAAGGGSGEIEMTTPASGEFKLKLVPDNTKNLKSGRYEYDFQMVLSSKTYTIIQDTFEILDDVTK